jgi:hypothetical protein
VEGSGRSVGSNLILEKSGAGMGDIFLGEISGFFGGLWFKKQQRLRKFRAAVVHSSNFIETL